MTIPNLTLDNTSFDEIFRKIRKQIPSFSNDWTDFNYSNSGIAFLELLVWLADNKIFSINDIPKRNYLKFLKLVGILPQKPIPAKIIFQIPKKIETENQDTIQKNSIMKSDSYNDVEFTTDFKFKAINVRLGQILLQPLLSSTKFIHPQEKLSDDIDWQIRPFGDNENVIKTSNQGFCIGLKIDNESLLPQSDGSVSVLHLAIKYEHENQDKFPFGDHCEKINEEKLGIARWEYFHGDDTNPEQRNKWRKFKVVSEDSDFLLNRHLNNDEFYLVDRTNGFTKNGIISIQIPFDHVDDFKDITNRNNDMFYWIRFSLKEEKLYNNPAIIINNIFFNCVSATQGIQKLKQTNNENQFLNECNKPELNNYSNNVLEENFKMMVERIPGNSNQKISLDHENIISVNSIATNNLPTYFEHVDDLWSEVTDFENSNPTDNHYVVDYDQGIIQFGDNINGKAPAKHAQIKINYSYGLPKNEIKKNSVFDLIVNGKKFEYAGKMKFLSQKGKSFEKLEDAIFRANREIRKPFSAVSLENFEYVVKNTPGLRVARSHAIVRNENKIGIIVIPYSKVPNPLPTKLFLDLVCEHLDHHRLLTTQIEILPPKYVEITTKVVLKGNDESQITEIQNALNEFLTPISSAGQNKGWIPGRSVYRSEIVSVINNVIGPNCIESLSIFAKSSNPNLFSIKNPNIQILDPQTFVYSGSHSVTLNGEDVSCRPENISENNYDTWLRDEPVCDLTEEES